MTDKIDTDLPSLRRRLTESSPFADDVVDLFRSAIPTPAELATQPKVIAQLRPGPLSDLDNEMSASTTRRLRESLEGIQMKNLNLEKPRDENDVASRRLAVALSHARRRGTARRLLNVVGAIRDCDSMAQFSLLISLAIQALPHVLIDHVKTLCPVATGLCVPPVQVRGARKKHTTWSLVYFVDDDLLRRTPGRGLNNVLARSNAQAILRDACVWSLQECSEAGDEHRQTCRAPDGVDVDVVDAAIRLPYSGRRRLHVACVASHAPTISLRTRLSHEPTEDDLGASMLPFLRSTSTRERAYAAGLASNTSNSVERSLLPCLWCTHYANQDALRLQHDD